MQNECVSKEIFEHLKTIQERTVQIALSSHQAEDNMEDLLNDVTYATIVELMTMIDGYGDFSRDQLDVINIKTNQRLKADPFIELHDQLEDFLI